MFRHSPVVFLNVFYVHVIQQFILKHLHSTQVYLCDKYTVLTSRS